MRIKSFEELEAWQRAYELALVIYALTRNFPREEQFGLTSQLRRAASSVGANIAEGFGRRSTGELLRSLRVANGEVEETRYFVRLSHDLSYVTEEEFQRVEALCRSLNQLLSALGRSLKAASSRVTSHELRVTTKARSA